MALDIDREYFSRRGYVVIHDVIPPATCEHLIDRAWEMLPERWDRGDPSTWTGTVSDSCHTSGLAYRRGHLKFQKGFLNADPQTHAAVGPDSLLGGLSASLLGGMPQVRYRGLYLLAPFPESKAVPQIPRPHVEAHPVQIVSTAYLNDVHPGCGGLFVWPGSHLDMYKLFDSKLEFSGREGCAETIQRYRHLEPVEIVAPAGSVILIHHRLLHAPSVNQGPAIRFALFTDYMAPRFRELAAEAPGDDPWEDWPGVPSTALADPVHDHPQRTVDMRRLKGLHLAPENASVQNKLDASRQIRAMKAGETWLILSGRGDLAGTNRIEPCGETLPGLVAFADGMALPSTTSNDFVAKIPEGTRIVSLEGAEGELWARLVRTRLPFSDSPLLFDGKLCPGESIRLDALGQPDAELALVGG